MALPSIVEIVVEEIALEGLDGITLPTLWLRLEDRAVGDMWNNNKARMLLWTSITGNRDFSFYQLPQPRPDIPQFDRYSRFDPDTRVYSHPEGEVLDIYKWEGVQEGEVIGSCPTFKTRKDVTADIRDEEGACLISYTEVMERWGRSLVIVASQSLRNIALTGSSDISGMIGDSAQRYYLLELIGRARGNGLTTGSVLPHFSSHPLNICPKLLYYLVKIMRQHKIVRKQCLRTRYKMKAVSISLLHLARFYRLLPDRVKEVTSLLCQYLGRQDNKHALVSVVKEKFSLKHKGLYRSVLKRAGDCLYVKSVPYREIFPNATSKEYLCKDKNGEKQLNMLALAREYKEEEEEESEEEKEEEGDENEEVAGKKVSGVWKKERSSLRDVLGEVYRVVHEGGVQGVRSNQIISELKQTYRTVRNAITCLKRQEKVQAVLKSLGSCRVSFYIAKPFVEASCVSFGKAMTEFRKKTTQFSTESTISEPVSDTMDSDTAKAPEASGVEIGEYSQLIADINPEETIGERTAVEMQLKKSEKAHTEKQRGKEKDREKATESKGTDDVLRNATNKTSAEPPPQTSSSTDQPVILDENGEERGAEGSTVGGGSELKDAEAEMRLPDIQCSIIENISADQVMKKTMANPICTKNLTERMLTIANCLLDGLKHCRLYDCLAASRRAIVKKMREQGETIRPPAFPGFRQSSQRKRKRTEEPDEESICLKTVLRIVDWCQREGKLKTFSIRLECGKKVTNSLLICATDVEREDPLLLRAIQHQKLRSFNFNPSKTKKLAVPLSMLDWQQMVSCGLKAVTPFSPCEFQRKMSTKWKKWEKAWWIHRFVWYLMHSYQGVGPGENAESADGQENNCAVENDETKEPHVYLDTDDWRRHIPPVRRHKEEGTPEGVCTVGDLLMVMPVFLFAPITNTQEIPIVREYLEDRKKSLYPVTEIPLPVLGSMVQRGLYINPVLDVFRNLCALGLLAVGQLIATSNRTKQSVFVRKTAMLLDTRESLPGNLFTVLPEHLASFPEMKFELDSMEKVQHYWATLQTIAFNTDLNNVGKTDYAEEAEEVYPMKECMSYRPFTQIVRDYCLPGNRRGAAGLDCGLFIRSSSLSKGAASSRGGPGSGKEGPQQQKHHLKKRWTVHREGFYPLPARYRTGRVGRGKKAEGKVRGNDRPMYDDVDRQAKQDMRGRRSKFTTKEISIMLLGKVALSYVVGDSINRTYFMPVRDVLHQRIHSSRDKTTMSIACCIRRHMKRTSIRHSMSHYLMRLINDKEMVAKYGSKLKLENNKAPCSQETSAFIQALINDIIDKYVTFETVHAEGTLPSSLYGLQGRYKVMLSEDSVEDAPWKDVACPSDCCGAALRDFQLSHVLSLEDKQARDYELYETLRHYPDHIVSRTLTRLVQKGLLTKNKRFPDGSYAAGIARYMIHFRYQLKLHQSRFPVKMFLGSAQVLNSLKPPPGHDGGNGGGSGEGGGITTPTTTDAEAAAAVAVAPYFHSLQQGTASASHVAFILGMTALHKLGMQMDTKADMINLSSSEQTTLMPETSSRGMKQGPEQRPHPPGGGGVREGVEEEEEEEEGGGQGQDDNNPTTDLLGGGGGGGGGGEEGGERRVLGSPPAKKRKKVKGDLPRPHFHSTPHAEKKNPPSQNTGSKRSSPSSALGKQSRGGKRTLPLPASPMQAKRRKHTFPPSTKTAGGADLSARDQSSLWSDSSSENEADSTTPHPAPATAKPLQRMYWRPESNQGELFVNRLRPDQEGSVQEVGDGEGGRLLELKSGDMCVRFNKVDQQLPTPLQARMLRYHASFTLLALRRCQQESILDPRKYSSSYRFSLSLSRIALALKERVEDWPRSSALPGVDGEVSFSSSSSGGVAQVPSSSSPSEVAREAALPAGPPSEVAREAVLSAGPPSEVAIEPALPAGPQPEVAREPALSAGPPPEVAKEPALPAGPPPEVAREPALSAGSPPEVAMEPALPAAAPPEVAREPALPGTSHPVEPTDEEDTDATQPNSPGETSALPIWVRPCESGASSPFVDREVLKRIVKEQTRRLPFEVDWDQWWHRCQRELDVDGYTSCQKTYRGIFDAGTLGATWTQLKS
ncbi:hypothetical protein ACOMHN_008790 [Nucella lapillus]